MQFRFSVAADSDTTDSCLAALKWSLQQSSSVWPDVSHSAISRTNVLALWRKEKRKERRKKRWKRIYAAVTTFTLFPHRRVRSRDPTTSNCGWWRNKRNKLWWKHVTALSVGEEEEELKKLFVEDRVRYIYILNLWQFCFFYKEQ